ncbi:hypothetical protein CR513_41291, partial [Mucuna pruriens]
MLGLSCIKKLYKKDIDFSEPFTMRVHAAFRDYYRYDDSLFKGKKLCVPMSSIGKLLVKEAHEGSLIGGGKDTWSSKDHSVKYRLQVLESLLEECQQEEEGNSLQGRRFNVGALEEKEISLPKEI